MKTQIQEISLVSQSSSAQMVASVDDLLIKIFLRVPMKPLVRFKSVSKHWQSLISDPGFGILRNPKPNPATGLILQDHTEFQLFPDESDPHSSASKPAPSAYIVSFDNDDTSPRIRTWKLIDSWPRYDRTTITSSCNGLILMCGSYNDLEFNPTRSDYYVCNPTTNKIFKLPQMPYEPDEMVPLMYLAFDPSKSPRYKVVCALILGYDIVGFRYQFLVYSSETGCWRKPCVEPFQAAISVNFQRGVYWNGAMHWVSSKKTGKSVYFDPDDDRMSQEIMPTPPRVNSNYYFGESCGHLHYIDTSRTSATELVAYELRRDYSEWFVKYRINHSPCSSVGGQRPYFCAVVRGKSDDDSFCVLMKGGRFLRYNFLSKTSETICQVRGTPLQDSFKYVHAYSPLQHADSLCPV